MNNVHFKQFSKNTVFFLVSLSDWEVHPHCPDVCHFFDECRRSIKGPATDPKLIWNPIAGQQYPISPQVFRVLWILPLWIVNGTCLFRFLMFVQDKHLVFRSNHCIKIEIFQNTCRFKLISPKYLHNTTSPKGQCNYRSSLFRTDGP